MHSRAAYLAAIAAALAFAAPGRAAWANRSPLADLDPIVQRGIDEQRYPGAVLVVGQGGKRLWTKAYGRHTYDPTSPPMRLDTLFDLASLSKVCGTTPAAMLLIEDGTIALDDPVAKYVAGFGANGKGDVTLRDLLTHVSGLKAYETFSVVERERRPDETHAEALYRHYAALPLAYKPRTRVLYSCINMQTLAAALQAAAGVPMQELLRKRLWGPLGMRDTTYRPSPAQVSRCAPTMAAPDGTPLRGRTHDPLASYHGAETLCPGNAGLFSTATDLAHYAEMVLNAGARGRKRILRPETVRTMTSVQTPDTVRPPRALGWEVYTGAPYAAGPPRQTDALALGHTGYTGTWIWLDKRTKAYAILLTNRVFPSPASDGGEGRAIGGIQRRVVEVVVRAVETEGSASASAPLRLGAGGSRRPRAGRRA